MNKREIYIPKAALLKWIAQTTKISITDIKQLSTGVHLCHLLHQLTDKKFKIGKVSNNAKTQADSLKNLRIFNEGLENCNIVEKFDVDISKTQINLILKKSFPVLLDAAQKMHKMFRQADKIKEKTVSKEDLLDNLRKKGEKGKKIEISPPKRGDENLTPEEFIKQMSKVQSMKKEPKICQNQQQQEFNLLPPESNKKHHQQTIKQGQKISDKLKTLQENKENQQQLYPDLDVQPTCLKYPILETFAPKAEQKINIIQNPFRITSKKKEQTPQNTPQFSQIKEKNKYSEEDPSNEPLLSSIKHSSKPNFGQPTFVTDNKKESQLKSKETKSRILQKSERVYPPNKSTQNSRSNSKKRSEHVSNQRSTKISPKHNPELKHSPSLFSSARTNLLNLDSKKKRLM